MEEIIWINYGCSKKALEKRKIFIPKNVKINNITTLVFVYINDRLAGILSLKDRIKIVRRNKRVEKHGIKCFMLTGDNKNI